MTVKPLGLLKSDAVLAINLVKETPAEAVKALKFLREEEQTISGKTAEFNQTKADVDNLIKKLYEERKL